MEYSEYWSILDTPSQNIKASTIGLYIAIVAGLLWIAIKKLKKDKGDGDKTILQWGVGAFGVFGLTMFILLSFVYRDESEEQALKLLNSPATPKVEGTVSNFQRTFRRTKYGSVTTESFRVDSVRFSYSDALLGKFGSFSETNNQVIFDGQKVRITYKPGSPKGENFNSILKLEIGH